ncbi:MAG: biotin--[acetyl-CoA-carboxylase] ligase [Mucilaginibacter polytrichastri]|nr:biotin--[acetyl-CoA-carboxylase] ligase [Mucilaginibacter polytrichastri]
MQNNIFSGLFVGQKFVHFAEIGSTNDFLKDKLANSEPLPDGTVIMADSQTAGRGQAGSRWHSAAGRNITASILFYPSKLAVNQQFDLNRAVSIALCETLRTFSGADVRIKWPNDLFVSGRKLCGMLIENTLSGGRIRASVVGFGINVNQADFPDDAGGPVSLVKIMGVESDRLALLGLLCSAIERKYLELLDGRHDHLRAEYDGLLLNMQKNAAFRAGERTFQGRITGTTPEGQLKMDTEKGTELFSIKTITYLGELSL